MDCVSGIARPDIVPVRPGLETVAWNLISVIHAVITDRRNFVFVEFSYSKRKKCVEHGVSAAEDRTPGSFRDCSLLRVTVVPESCIRC